MHMVNKKIAEMLIACLPCHFGYGKAPVPCARSTPLAVLNDMQILTVTVGVRSMENKIILPHAHKQAKIYLLDCSNETIEALTLEDSKAVNESRFSWVM